MIGLPRSVASIGEAMYQSAFLSLQLRLKTGKNCAYVTIVIVSKLGLKSLLLHIFYYRSFRLFKLNFLYVVYQGMKIAFQNALFLVFFFQSAKPSNLWALLIRSEYALQGVIFTSLICVVTVIPDLRVKDHFN